MTRLFNTSLPQDSHRRSPLTSITKHVHSPLERGGITEATNFSCLCVEREEKASLLSRRWQNEARQRARSPTRCLHGRRLNLGKFHQAKMSWGGRVFFMASEHLDSIHTSPLCCIIMWQYLSCLHSTQCSTASDSLASVSSSEASLHHMTSLMSKSPVNKRLRFSFSLFFKDKF